MKFFTSIVESCKDIAGKLRNISASANGIRFENRQMMQHFGFCSSPKKGDRVLLLQFGNVVIAVASDSADRPSIKEGESAVYRSSGHYIKLNEDGSVEIKTEKGVDIKGDLRVSGDVWDNTDNPAVSNSMKNMRDILNQQTHGTAVGPSSTGVPPILPSPPPTV